MLATLLQCQSSSACPAGHACPPDALTPSKCAPGTFSPGGNATLCTLCPAGRFGNSSGLADRACSGPCVGSPGAPCTPGASEPTGVPCDPGFFAAANRTECAPCPVGTFSEGGAPECSLCPVGRYGNASRMPFASCTGECAAAKGFVCPAGATDHAGVPCPPHTTSAGGITVCLCEAGANCANGTANATLCPPGTASLAGAPSCTLCKPGEFSDVEGAEDCKVCPAGYECPSEGMTAAGAECVAGYFSTHRQVACTPCPLGRYGSGPGETSADCSGECSAGPGLHCGLAEVSPVGSRCPNGTTSASTGAPCECVAGWACPDGNPRAVTVCPAGRYSAANATTCTPCTAGRFGNVTGLTSASCAGACNADAGHVCAEGAVTSTGNACPAGLYAPGNSTQCLPCPAGRFGNDSAQASANCSGVCTAAKGFACGPGSTTSAGAECPLGYSSSGGSAPCECKAGWACPGDGANATQCPAGTFSRKNSPVCKNCTDGYYSREVGAADCQYSCDAGSYCPEGATGRLPCPMGYFSEDLAMACSPCPVGRFGNRTHQVSANCSGVCTAGPGLHCGLAEVSPVGSLCPNGTTSAGAGAPCECVAGWACPDGNPPAATVCPAGRYSAANATTCAPCAAGRFGNATGLTSASCTGACNADAGYECPPGATSSTGQPCARGYARDNATDSDALCDACPPGEYAPDEGASDCTACPAGFECPTNASTSPGPCPVSARPCRGVRRRGGGPPPLVFVLRSLRRPHVNVSACMPAPCGFVVAVLEFLLCGELALPDDAVFLPVFSCCCAGWQVLCKAVSHVQSVPSGHIR